MPKRSSALIAIFAFAFLGGGMGAITKIGLQDTSPISFAFLRFLIASFCILPFFIRYKKNALKNIKMLLLVSLLATANMLLFTFGVEHTTATISQLLYAGIPLITGMIMFLFFHERMKQEKLIGILIGFIGVLLIVLLPIIQNNMAYSGSMVGNLIIFVAVLCWSFYLVYSKKYLKEFSPFVIISIFIFSSTIILAPFFLVEAVADPTLFSKITFAGIGSLFYAAIPGTIINFILTQYAIKSGGVVYTSLAFYLQPLFGYLFGYVLLGEQLTTGLLFGSLFILFGITLVMKKKL